jgi:hypothetical protein
MEVRSQGEGVLFAAGPVVAERLEKIEISLGERLLLE